MPYRASRLTKLLQSSLGGGGGRTLMVACVSAEQADLAETMNTLSYAATARQIATRPQRTMDPQQRLRMTERLAELEERSAQLSRLLSSQSEVLRQKQSFIDRLGGEMLALGRRAAAAETACAKAVQELAVARKQNERLAVQLRRRRWRSKRRGQGGGGQGGGGGARRRGSQAGGRRRRPRRGGSGGGRRPRRRRPRRRRKAGGQGGGARRRRRWGKAWKPIRPRTRWLP